MTEPLSIAALRTEAETTYEALPLTLESGAAVWLRSMLMLAEADYAVVEQLLEEINAASADNRLTAAIGAMRRLLLLVADDPAILEPELTGWPLGLLVNLIERWQNGTQVPEAVSSAS
nr:phage tail assembly protein [Streptomyces sp. NBC_00857]